MPEYVNRDYQAVYDDLLSQLPALAPQWTNQNDGDFGIAILKLLAGTADLMNYYLDRNAEEAFLSTAITREAVQRLCTLVDYRLARPYAAQATLRFTLPSAAGSDLVIPQYTVCRTAQGQKWVTKEAATIFTGQTYVDVSAFQGELVQETITGTGEAIQEFNLSQSGAAQNFLVITTGSQVWTEDRHDVDPTTEFVFQAFADSSDNVQLRFSSFLGRIPAQNETVGVTYIRTDGVRGNIGAGIVTQIVTTITGGGSLTVTNVTTGSGGKARESLNNARLNAPRQLRLLNRVVTLQDFEDAILLFPDAVKAQAINHTGYVELYVALSALAQFYVVRPLITSLTAVTDGTSALSAGTLYAAVTMVDANGGETTTWEYTPATKAVVDNEDSVVIASGERADLVFTRPEGAVSAKVYVGTASGTLYLDQTVDITGTAVGAAVTIALKTDPNSGNATPPTKNTTGFRGTDGVSSLRQEMFDWLEARRLLGATFALFNETQVSVNVTATVTVFDNYSRSAVQAQVEAAIIDFFDVKNQEFATDVQPSELYAAIMSVPGVKFVTISAPSAATTINDGEIAVLGTQTISMLGGVV